nr:immunoglobulin light chain junction region [Macaca mulatta]
CQQYDSGPYSF